MKKVTFKKIPFDDYRVYRGGTCITMRKDGAIYVPKKIIEAAAPTLPIDECLFYSVFTPESDDLILGIKLLKDNKKGRIDIRKSKFDKFGASVQLRAVLKSLDVEPKKLKEVKYDTSRKNMIIVDLSQLK